jgi:small nuclear ribonucleoprotein (snRNP)-like protein
MPADEYQSGKRRRRCDEFTTTSAPRNSMPIPISLGKPSLRRRLEDYYSLIAPDVTANEAEWRRKFELIYDKYGGSEEKELTLARKLAKKYGNVVRLRLTSKTHDNQSAKNTLHQKGKGGIGNDKVLHSEDWYNISLSQQNNGVIDLLSPDFGPCAVLSASSAEIYRINPFLDQSPVLDNIDKFRTLLPSCDPLRREPIVRTKKVGDSAQSANKVDQMRKKIPVFTAMAAKYEKSGPLSLLHSIHIERKKVKVMVRYVDCIRGTLTGYLIAFDKHMNMLLRDVDEVYTSRVTKLFEGEGHSKSELELKRRRASLSFQQSMNRTKGRNSNGKHEAKVSCEFRIKVGNRHLPQLLVRGDNVVSIWKAGDEKLAQNTI